MVFVAPSGRRFPDKLQFDSGAARRLIPKKLRAMGWSEEDIRRAMEGVEEIIRTSEPIES